MRNYFLILSLLMTVAFTGCAAVREAGNKTGEVIGEGANTVGSVTEGGAGAIQGKTTSEENPYNR